MKKRVLLSALMMLVMAFVLQPRKGHFSLEEFGGLAWYLPCDGRFQAGMQYPLIDFTPASEDPSILRSQKLDSRNCTKITAKTSDEFFPEEIVGKRFCGLFAHKNPSLPDYSKVDEFYPQELGSRYATVIARLDGQNVIVDFEFNGGNIQKPQKIINGKGYFFYDNSQAWDMLRQAFLEKTNTETEIRLLGFELNDKIQTLYVIPQYQAWKCNQTNIRIWSGTDKIPAVKIGYEDYYRLENRMGITAVQQSDNLFVLPGQHVSHNLVVKLRLYPPHRTILEAGTFMRTVFTGRKAAGITALVGSTQLDEERFIVAGKGLTQETFITWNFSSISSGGKLMPDSEGVMQDIAEFGFVLCKNYEQRGPFFTQMQGHAGNFLVVEDASLDFENQNAISPTSELLSIKINKGIDAYKGLPEEIQKRKKWYLPYVFEVEGTGNLFKVMAMGGSNRMNLLAFKGSKGVYTFIASVQGARSGVSADFFGYWDMFFVPKSERSGWGMNKKRQEWFSRTSSKLMVFEQIPEKNKRYTISRHYEIKEGEKKLLNFDNAQLVQINKDTKKANRKPEKGSLYSNAVRTAVAWTTVLGKYGNDVNPSKDIPANGKPLALQPGDRFTIPAFKGSTHNPETHYTVTRKDRGPWPSYAVECVAVKNRQDWEYNFNNPQGYRYFWCELDRDLPETIGLTFEIEIVESNSQELLDEKPRPVWHTYKGVDRLSENQTGMPNTQNSLGLGGYGVNSPFNSTLFSNGESHAHLCYSQVELTEWYKNVKWNNGFYRQNSNSGRDFKTFTIKNEQGFNQKVNPLARYSAGKTFINCSDGPIGQYSMKLNDFGVRDQIQRFQGIMLPEKEKAKMRLYNSPKVRTKGLKEPEKYLEIHPTEKGAPDMPWECKELLKTLIIE